MRLFLIAGLSIFMLGASAVDVVAIQGMQRVGVGSFASAFPTRDMRSGYDDFRVGFFHNWAHWKDHLTGSNRLPDMPPDEVTFAALVGGYGPTLCNESRVAELADLPDGTYVWVGNELGWDDRRDPTTFATQYKSWYDCIKAVNPNLLVFPGANPGHMTFHYWDTRVPYWEIPNDPRGRWSVDDRPTVREYYDFVLEDYQRIHGEKLPADGFVFHAYGAGGGVSWLDVDHVKESVRQSRIFMKDHGYQDLPMVIKEFGFLAPEGTQQEMNQSMVAMHEMMLHYRDQSLGNPLDNHRMVQRFTWFIAKSNEDSGWSQTAFIHCVDCGVDRQVTPLGQAFKNWAQGVDYDYQPPAKPQVSFDFVGSGKVRVNYQGSDNGRINQYQLAVGGQAGTADVSVWQTNRLQTSKEYSVSEVVGKYVSVKSVDDGYNWSDVSSVRVVSAGDIDGDGDVDAVDGGVCRAQSGSGQCGVFDYLQAVEYFGEGI